MITIDGSQGEGGGQVLRTALALAAITGQPITLEAIRGGRRKPGLLRQHLTCVRAAAEICGAEVEGGALGSDRVVFRPGAVQPGAYSFAVGSAGSANLVLQTVMPILLSASEDSLVEVSGGTHNDKAPTSDFLRTVFAPALARFGPTIEVETVGHGFYPAGGGTVRATLTPAPWRPTELARRGGAPELYIQTTYAELPARVAHHQNELLGQDLDIPRSRRRAVPVQSPGPGNVLAVHARTPHGDAQFTGFGSRKRATADLVADVRRQVDRWLSHDVVVCEHLADQLLLPMALAGDSAIATTTPSLHTRTNAAILETMLPVRFAFTEHRGAWRIAVRPTP